MPSDNKSGCGISWLWFDSYDDYRGACLAHDHAFDMHEGGAPVATRKEVDNMFLQIMLHEAKGSVKKKLKAYTYYGIVRLVGGLFW